MTASSSPDAHASLLRQALKGVVALGARQALVQIANLIGGIALVRLLLPKDYGMYAVISFVLSFATTLGDVGLYLFGLGTDTRVHRGATRSVPTTGGGW